jgi:hypothetical protein
MSDYVRYIDKTREYYSSIGYDKPYQWAHFDDVPFTPLSKSLADSTVMLVSTGEVEIRGRDLNQDDAQMGNLGGVYEIPADVEVEDLYSPSHSYDKHATTLEDVNAFFPIEQLRAAVGAGRIGRLAETLVGVYNAYSKRLTTERDAPEVLSICHREGADVAVLVPV